jgi:hypothetical protein
MNQGTLVFAQLMSLLPQRQFQRIVDKHNGNRNTRTFSCWDQFLCMAFAQLTYRESLRDIEACLRAVGIKLYHLGIRGKVSRSTLADANNARSWKIFADFAQLLIKEARTLYVDDPFDLELDNAIYALDATVVDLCLSLFPWANYDCRSKGGIKVHTLLDLRGNIPIFVAITRRKVYELAVLDSMVLEPGAFYIMDRGYFDWKRLYRITTSKAFFVIRPKKDVSLRRLYSKPVDRITGVISDQIIMSRGSSGHKLRYPEKLRRIRYFDQDTERYFVYLTNNFQLPAATIAALYKKRWHIELFFKWIKQHLRIKAFYGTSENAMKTQIWIAITVYLLVAIAKKRFKLPHSLYSILQVLSVTLFEKKPILQAFCEHTSHIPEPPLINQLDLF